MKSYGPLHVLLGKMMRTDTVYMKTLESFSELLVDFWLLWKSLFFFALVEFFFPFFFCEIFLHFCFCGVFVAFANEESIQYGNIFICLK